MYLEKKTIEHLLDSQVNLRALKTWYEEDYDDVISFINSVKENFSILSNEHKLKFMLMLMTLEYFDGFSFISSTDIFSFLMKFRISSKNHICYVHEKKPFSTKDIDYSAIEIIARTRLSEEEKQIWINEFISRPTPQSISFLKNYEYWWDYYDKNRLVNNYKKFLGTKDSFYPHIVAQIGKGRKEKTYKIMLHFLKTVKDKVIENNFDDFVLITNMLSINKDILTHDEKVKCLKGFLNKFIKVQDDFNQMTENQFKNKYHKKQIMSKRSLAISFIEKEKKEFIYGAKKMFWYESWLELDKTCKNKYKQRKVDGVSPPPIVAINNLPETYSNEMIHEGELVMILRNLGFSCSSSFSYLTRLKEKKKVALISHMFENKMEDSNDIECWIKKMETYAMFSQIGSLYKTIPQTSRAYLSYEYPEVFTIQNIKQSGKRSEDKNFCEILGNFLYYADDDFNLNDDFKELLKMNFKK